jgi:hypothetical protein
MLLLLLACNPPDPTAAADVVGAAGPIAYAASAATAALTTEGAACADLVTECVTEPCAVAVNVSVDMDCQLPVAVNASGEIPVVGTLTESGAAVLGADFSGVTVPDGRLRVREITAFTATITEEGLDVAYVLQDAGLTDALAGASTDEVGVEQSAFAVQVERPSPATPVGARYTINGGAQIVRGETVWQVALTDVVLDSTCQKNPVSGAAILEDVSEDNLGVTTFLFHEACDGRVDIAGSIGASTAWSGRSVDFPQAE